MRRFLSLCLTVAILFSFCGVTAFSQDASDEEIIALEEVLEEPLEDADTTTEIVEEVESPDEELSLDDEEVSDEVGSGDEELSDDEEISDDEELSDDEVGSDDVVGDEESSDEEESEEATASVEAEQAVVLEADHDGYTELTTKTVSNNLSTGKYYLGESIELTSDWTIPSGREITLDLNGFDVSTKGSSTVLIVNGTLNLEDGTAGVRYYNLDGETETGDDAVAVTGGIITGGENGYGNLGGGGVYVSSTGVFNMTSGNIVGNTTTADTHLGGGVYVAEGGTFKMSGGVIAYNSTEEAIGGGVYNKGTFHMSGGEIAYNECGTLATKYGGGVYNAGDFEMSDDASIHHNYASAGGGGISTIGDITMTDTASISNNVAAGSCGGIFLAENGVVNMSGSSTISNNHANTNGGLGIRYSSSKLIMSGNASISGNTTNNAAAGVYLTSGGTFEISGGASVSENFANTTQGASEGTTSNIYLNTGNAITVTDTYTGNSGFTHVSGEGLVATGDTTQYTVLGETVHFTSDVDDLYLVKETAEGDEASDELYLKVAEVKEGNNKTATYAAAGIDLTEILEKMFEIDDSISYTYAVKEGTGEGTLSSGVLDVDLVGTFIVSATVPRTEETEVPYVTTATLTVEPKTITIDASSTIASEERGADYGSLQTSIDIDNTTVELDGVEGEDEVSIYFEDAYGVIDTSDFESGKTLDDYLVSGSEYATETDGVYTFDVTVKNLKLTGEDADNYVLEDNTFDSVVVLNVAMPYISWPTAEEVVFGNPRTNDDFYGGKVVVRETNGSYTDITEFGQFEWVGDELEAENKVGTYSYSVKFVEDIDSTHYDEDASYRTNLDSTTHIVSQIVEAASVTFTIADNTLDYTKNETLNMTAKDENGNDVTDFTPWYTINDVWGTTEPTYAVGSYLVGASLSENYHHADTLVNSAKQLGAIIVYDGEGNEPTTYTATLYYPNGSTYCTIEGALEQDIHILPELTDEYSGWDYDGTTYNLGGRFTQPASDITLTAIEAPEKTQTISGIITGTDLDGSTGELSGIAVGLWQGSELVEKLTTGTDGEYEFTVAPGYYNLVITRDLASSYRCEITKFVDVTTDDYNVSYSLPDVVENAVLEIAKGMPDITVQGLTLLAESFTKEGTEDSEVYLQITDEAGDSGDVKAILEKAAENNLDENNVKLYFNIDITAKVGSASSYSPVTELDDCLTFYVPLTGVYQGHKNYAVYRLHDGEVDILTTKANSEGEYMKVEDDMLIIHAKYFSLYGMSFDNFTTSSSSSSNSIYQPILDAGDGGSISNISISNPTRGNVVKFYVSADDGYTLDDLVIYDADGNEYEITDLGGGWYSYVQPATVVVIAATFDGDDVDDSDDADEADASEDTEDTDTESSLPFTDVDITDWFYSDVKYLYEKGIMSGVSDSIFDPYGGNTRAMVAQLMYILEGRQERTEFDFFPDVVVGQWHEEAINWCATYSVVDGYDDGLYRPDRVISREEYTSILYGYCEDRGYDMSNLDDLTSFNDEPTNWAKTYVMWAVAQGIVVGDAEGNLNAKDQLTRAEAAAILARFLKNVYQG